MKIFLKLFFVVVIFFSHSAANAQVLQQLKNFLSGSTCGSSSDCPQGFSCRSKTGGGSQCLRTVECESSSDCPQGLSCRSTAGGGTECKKSSDQNSASEKKSSSNDADHNQQPKSVVEPVNALVNENTFTGPAGVEIVIYFDFDSYTIKPKFQATIEAHAQYLKANRNTKLSIKGHTDKAFPSLEYSLSLGQKRADAVRQSLILMGVDSSRVEAVSLGREKPLFQGNDESAFSKNRRVEFFYK
jgi:peptidoglycan-associated lipoprotein